MSQTDKQNNFDLLRFFAAFQVMLYHGIEHFQIKGSPWLPEVYRLIGFFPGVPIFFFMSGFLVFWSYQRNQSNKKQFIINRALRIYPGLWVCLLFTLVVLFSTQTLSLSKIFHPKILVWLGTQITFFQFYTSDALRSFGLGNPNGNLWTVSVELQFYFVVPLLFFFVSQTASKAKQFMVFVTFFLISLGFNGLTHFLPAQAIYLKLLKTSFLTHFFNFALGACAFFYFEHIKKWVEDKFWIWIFVYGLYIGIFGYIFKIYAPSYYPNLGGLISTLLLCMTALSFAYSHKSLSSKIVRGQDLSYGLYLYHGVVLNWMIHTNRKGEWVHLLQLFVVSFFLALFSWNIIEKRALKWKSIFSSKKE